MKEIQRPIILPKDIKNFKELDQFLGYLEAIQGRSTLTIKEYRYDLILFFRFYKQYKKLIPKDLTFKQITIEDISKEDLNNIELQDLYAFISWLSREKNASAPNRARKIATLRSFFKYLHNKLGTIKHNPAYELESPKLSKSLPKYLDIEESKKLLSAATNQSKNFSARDYCILTLFLNCGMRLSELAQINIQDIQEDTLTVLGKGNKERTIYLNGACTQAINDYLDIRDSLPGHETPALFLSRQGNRLSKPAIQLLVKKYILYSGLDPKKYSVHKLRHTAATLMYKYGKVDIRLLQQILGHQSISTTEIYTHVDADDLHEAVENNPLASERK